MGPRLGVERRNGNFWRQLDSEGKAVLEVNKSIVAGDVKETATVRNSNGENIADCVVVYDNDNSENLKKNRPPILVHNVAQELREGNLDVITFNEMINTSP